MTKINLLPWRETHRKDTNNKYYATIAMFALLAGGIVFGGYKFVDDKVAFQKKRNDRLNREIALLAKELEEIQALEETKNNLLARMEIIQQLQGQRPVIVHSFQELAENIPDGVFLTALKQQGEQQVVLEGRAESNARVSALMRRLDQSEYYTNPRLDVIAADKQVGFSTFKLELTQVSPHMKKEETDGI